MKSAKSAPHRPLVRRIVPILISTVSVLSALITIYVFVFQRHKVELSFQITNEINALDINESVPNLQIFYNKEDILTAKKNLRLIDVKVSNTGDVDILKDFYDSNSPIGLAVEGAEVIQVPYISDASSDYLQRNVSLRLISNAQVVIDPIILERGEYFSLRLTVVHPLGTAPTLRTFGKVAGVRTLSLDQKTIQRSNVSFGAQVFQGNVLIQLIRALIYFLATVLGILAAAGVGAGVTSIVKRIQRSHHIALFKDSEGYFYKNLDGPIFKRYVREGRDFINWSVWILTQEKNLTKAVTDALESKHDAMYLSHGDIEMFEQGIPLAFTGRVHLSAMLEDGLLFNKGKAYVANDPMVETLKMFKKFLDKKVKDKRLEADRRVQPHSRTT
jgi:hypothetical protein